LSSYDSSVGFKAAIDGPYGGYQMLHRYGHVVLFAQGIGIAAQMSYLRTAFYGSLRGNLPTRRITLVWETYDKDLVIVQNWITHLLREDHDNYNRTLMLDIQLFILDQQDALRYGRRVKAFAGPIDVKGVIREELKNRRGRMLFTVSASEHFVDQLRLHMLEVMDGDFKNEQLELLCLEFQPQKPHKRTSGGGRTVDV
ncbi:hypothetical protein KXX35_008236, partial [Aspergillus fumigatus]